MDETRAWAKEHDLAGKIRSIDGVKDLELSFCPGEGWLAARYIFTDLDDMKSFLGDDNATMAELKVVLAGYEHYDTTRDPQEFKGFFCEEL
jgi:hypothetical protein